MCFGVENRGRRVDECHGQELNLLGNGHSVSDTGIGIPAAEHESIFNKFHQVGATTSGVREGTGLDLPITRLLVEEHGGRILLES